MHPFTRTLLSTALLLAQPLAAQAALLHNGSFENPAGTWVNTAANYMAVASGSPALTGWSVVNAQGRGVAWAQNPTGDGFFARDGAFFVDLSGFGTEAGTAAALEQTLQNLVVGQSYTVGIDYWGEGAALHVGGTQLAAAAVASGGWVHLSGSFTATAAQSLLSIRRTGSSGVAFVDNVTVSGPDGSALAPGANLPEPGTLALAGAALLALRLRRPRFATR